jgi:mono/diheme cytochrome c family protein
VSNFLKSILLGFVAVAVAGCKSLPPPTPLAALNPQQDHGHQIFETHCAACH